MKLTALLGKYLQSIDKSSSIPYISKHNMDVEIPKNIVEFIAKINGNEVIKEEEFHVFSKQLSTLDGKVKDCIIHLLSSISADKYKENEEEIEKAVTSIENNLKQGREIPKSSGKNAKKYIGLLNCYRLFASHVSIYEGCTYFTYPGITPHERDNVVTQIPFAINALRLVGELPITDNFNGFNLSKPFYPLKLDIVKNEKVPIKKGVKDSDDYYPYKMVSKIAKGDTGDNTFVATNGKKILFVRGVERYSPDAVLASKIATLVSPSHFSSERLLDNHLVGSRGLSNYAVSVADNRIRSDRKRYIEQEKRIFPGSGIIDEVANFINENDPNIENFGLSSTDVYQSHLTKIDFDGCNVTSKISKDKYERNILTRPRGGIYHSAPHIQTAPDYIQEKLFARLKLSMLPQALLSSLAEKAFAPEDAQSGKKAVKECTNRSNMALELFFEHPQAVSFLKQDPSILNQCYHQIAEYISTHFTEEDQELLQRSLRNRVDTIQNNIKSTLGIKLTLTDYIKPEIVEKSSLAEHKQDVDSIVESAHSTEMEQGTKPEVTTSESTFLSRHWLKLSGIVLSTLIGVGVGLALTATGIFAPLGVGIVGLTVAAAVGFAVGIAVGSAIFGAKIAYDEHLYQASKPVEDIDDEDALKPSLSVQNLIQQVEVASQRLDNGIAKVEDGLALVHKKSRIQAEEPEHGLSSKFEIK